MAVIRQFTDIEAISRTVAGEIMAATGQTDRFRLVLAGGSTPGRLYELLANAGPGIDWSRLRIYWGDERFVSHDHPASNFRLAADTFLPMVPADQVFPMPTDCPTADQAASRYNQLLNDHLTASPDGLLFDLVLLGMGEDGHTASLFPGHPLLAETKRLAGAVNDPVGRPPLPRITLTLPAFAAGRRVLFMVAGPEKKRLALQIAAGRRQCPAAMVRGAERLDWYIADT